MANLIELLQTQLDLKTILAVTEASGWDAALKGPALFTLFAPTDRAFASLPPGMVAKMFRGVNLLQLTSFLTCHLTTGRLLPADMADLSQITTLSGYNLPVEHPTAAAGYLTLNGVEFGPTFIEADNGVLYILEKILLPV